ncbi:MAG: hypothetical protein HY260_12055 [Chloroflexi bacterium]|nr:hypothetical protein [Chloroflexota bacterium]
MAKTLFYRLFGVGRIPAAVMAELQQEGILLVDEGVRGSATYRNFRKPGRADSWRRQWYTASIALTNIRLLALWGSNPIINAPLADERLRSMRYSLEDKAAVLCVAFDAALFHADWSGTIEYRFRTPQAQHLLELIQQRIG